MCPRPGRTSGCKKGIGTITSFDASAFTTTFGGQIKDFDATKYIPAKDVKKMDTFIHYGMAASIEAITDSGLEVTEANAERIGVLIGSGIGGLPGIERAMACSWRAGRARSPCSSCRANINATWSPATRFDWHGFKGPNYAIVSACATGTHSIGDAARLIEYGDVDVMVAGGAEMATSPTGLGGFAAAKALSTRNDSPETASRPWDRDRDGFVLSDGAGIMVLEEYEHARRRGARIYAELIGYGANSDAHHMTAPSPGGEGASRCMRLAIRSAGLNPQQIDYINAHGTSTPFGDKAETDAVKTVFGDHAYKLAMSSTKSMVGHMLGAAGGAEAVFCVLAIRDQVAPPTINLFTPDPECDLDYVPNQAREMKLDIVLSNSFGFGGTNGTLIFKRP
ncbi:MAG: beta-ketoacyl-ACP synthase II [Gammaproteobacteria bacterium]